MDTLVTHIDDYTLAVIALQKHVTEAYESLRELRDHAELAGSEPDRMARIAVALEAAAAFRLSVEAIQ